VPVARLALVEKRVAWYLLDGDRPVVVRRAPAPVQL